MTHENADFDALAALLGANKVYSEAVAVLPRRMNRNVRSFCALYCDALPFIRQEDLPRGKFRQVLLVDTQSFPSARGARQDARVHIVDHHPLARELKKGITFFGGDVGATTTLFVEEIHEKELPLTSIEATLLLLGIYEDTGSLSYVTTTPRDIRAAAFLVEQGGNLAVVNDFLNHPLTDAQRKLYQRLIERTQVIDIAGHTIAIATARAGVYTEEVSTLAHQLRELHDPAALFVLVQMDDHIQMVARSDRAAIDVAAIAEAFGGGGHDKAAAALIRGSDLRRTKAKLLKLLKTSVKPSVNVRKVMSFGVHTLEPDTTVAHAAEMMNRYGHEGFPVVRRSKLVGVLTRREIDRAMHHKLAAAPIKNFMQKPVAVSPDDSLEKLRALMIETDVGQVPVVDARGKQIIGIVTRTDLIKEWGIVHPARAADMAKRLEKWLPSQLLALLREAGEAAHELGYSVYIVGGFVRDLLLNQPNLDLDLVVEGDAIALAKHLAKKRGGRVHGHTRFGTAKWIINAETPRRSVSADAIPIDHLDFTTARTEFYAHPSALPEVETSSIKQDLRRRDFTINTLAICIDPERYGQLLDPFGGEADLQRGLIRVLHNLSFIEDPTRILRAVRLEQRLGFKIEPRSAQLIGDALDMLPRVSGDRLRHEVTLMFQESEPEKAMARLAELGVLRAIFPKLKFDPWHAEKFRAARESGDAKPVAYWGLLVQHLTQAEAREFARRLKLSNAEMETLLQLLALREEVTAPLSRPPTKLTPSTIYRLLEEYSDDALAIFALTTDDALVRERVALFRTRLRKIAPALTGDDLKRMGIPTGPAYRKILARLRNARLDGEVSTRAEEEKMVRSELRE